VESQAMNIQRRAASRLYLVTPRIGDAAPLVAALAAALACADVAAVLLRSDDVDERTRIDQVKALAPLVQRTGAALLVDGRSQIVARAGADGAHLTGIEALALALPDLKPDRMIAGVGGLESRHDAMLAAERGADYVMFGDPAPDGRRPAFSAIAERTAWWTEVFEVPCVGYAASLEEVTELARARAEFIAVGDLVFADPRGPAVATAEVWERMNVETVP
jgi:thiamine-phosphate pyrophosphorylase